MIVSIDRQRQLRQEADQLTLDTSINRITTILEVGSVDLGDGRADEDGEGSDLGEEHVCSVVVGDESKEK